MNETAFNVLADQTLAELEQRLEQCGADIDYDVRPGGILELEFDDGGKIIINRHTAAREIWVAARSGGFHFRYEASKESNKTGCWIGTRDGVELFAALSRCMSEHIGQPTLL